MQYTLFTAALGLATLSSASVTSNAPRDASHIRLSVNAVHKSSLSKRHDEVQLQNSRHGILYYIDGHVGTPPQPVTLQLDTGSSVTWVNPDCSTALGSDNVQACEALPQFNWQKSSTLVNEELPMDLSYGIGWAKGGYATDVFTLGNAKILHQEIGVANSSDELQAGILGISPKIGGTGHPVIVDNLATQGFIKSRALSLDLREVSSPVGSVIFGGVDTKKYEGNLEKLPMLSPAQAPDGTDRYWVNLSGMGIKKPGQAEKKYSLNGDLPVFLDCGATLSWLPSAIVQQIVADFPDATYVASSNEYMVPCSDANLDGAFTFTFGNKVINVPYGSFITTITGAQCALGIRSSTSLISLGDTFLRAAYVVYDQDNRNIHLAQAANCGANVVEIGSGPNAVPSIAGCGSAPTSTTTTVKPTSTKTSNKPTSTKTSTKPTSSASGATTATTAPGTTTVATYSATTSTTSSPPSYPSGNGTVSTICSTSVYTNPSGQISTQTFSQYTTYYPGTQTAPGSTGTGYPAPPPPSGTSVPAPITGSAGKIASSMVAIFVAAVAAVMML